MAKKKKKIKGISSSDCFLQRQFHQMALEDGWGALSPVGTHSQREAGWMERGPTAEVIQPGVRSVQSTPHSISSQMGLAFISRSDGAGGKRFVSDVLLRAIWVKLEAVMPFPFRSLLPSGHQPVNFVWEPFFF